MAIVAGTPTLMPTMPAFTRCLNSRAAAPDRVKIAAPLPKAERLARSIAASRSVHAHDIEDRAEDLLPGERHLLLDPVDDRRSEIEPARGLRHLRTAAAVADDFGALLLAARDQAGHPVAVLAR